MKAIYIALAVLAFIAVSYLLSSPVDVPPECAGKMICIFLTK